MPAPLHVKHFAVIFLMLHLAGGFAGIAYVNNSEQPAFPFCAYGGEFVSDYSDEDVRRHAALMDYLDTRVSPAAPVGEIIAAVGYFFLNTEYVDGTLDQHADEKLVINLRGLDCVTFVEYAVAAALAYRSQHTGFDDFSEMMRCLRYRNGQIDGYSSRMHYFSEWLLDNESKGILKIISNDIGSAPMDTVIDFMSSNPHLYPQLADKHNLTRIRDIEKALSARSLHYVPTADLAGLEEAFRHGDILAFVTRIDGLDVSHTGFVYRKNGKLHLLHASTRSNMVEISAEPLAVYLQQQPRVAGVLTGRVL